MIIDPKAAVTPTSSKLAVIEALFEFGTMSRSDLADELDLTRPALTEICRELIAVGLIHETDVKYSYGRLGRPSILLSLNKKHGYFMGICITDDSPMLVACDLRGSVIASREISSSDQPEVLAKIIKDGINHLLRTEKIPRKQLPGLGIALSGFVDPFRGICLRSNQLDWSNVPIVEIVSRVIGIPVYVENDANSVATGEKIFGEARKSSNFSIVIFNHSIGAGHYIQGRLYRGHNGGAGEIGHSTIDPGGEACSCGKIGCLDTISGRKAILETARRDNLKVGTMRDLEYLAARGNRKAVNILQNAGKALGLAAANVIQINNPEILSLTFTEDLEGGIFMTTVRQTIEKNIFPSFISSISLLFHRVDKYFWARGAAATAAHGFLRRRVQERV